MQKEDDVSSAESFPLLTHIDVTWRGVGWPPLSELISCCQYKGPTRSELFDHRLHRQHSTHTKPRWRGELCTVRIFNIKI